MQTKKQQLTITPLPDTDPIVGTWLGAYEDCRARTLRRLEGFDEALVDWLPQEGASVGAIIYHIAAIEASWLYDDVLDDQWPDDFGTHFTYPVRENGLHLTPVAGETLAQHLDRLSHIHINLLDKYGQMTLEEFRRVRQRDDYDVTPEWVIQHLMQHEAGHRSQLINVREQAESGKD